MVCGGSLKRSRGKTRLWTSSVAGEGLSLLGGSSPALKFHLPVLVEGEGTDLETRTDGNLKA